MVINGSLPFFFFFTFSRLAEEKTSHPFFQPALRWHLPEASDVLPMTKCRVCGFGPVGGDQERIFVAFFDEVLLMGDLQRIPGWHGKNRENE